MVERCHRTIEDVVRKVMTDQTDWVKMLNSVLFSIRCQTHSSTGFSPMRMLFNKDPILPFQHADKTENCPDPDPFSTKDPVVDMVEKLDVQRTAIFDKASSKIANKLMPGLITTSMGQEYHLRLEINASNETSGWTLIRPN